MSNHKQIKEPLPRIQNICREVREKGLKEQRKRLRKEGISVKRTNNVKNDMSQQNGSGTINGHINAESVSDGHVASASTTTETTGSTYAFSLDEEGEHNRKDEFHYDDVNTTNFGRQKWPKRLEFVLILVGFTVGLGNVWRFPYLCHKNGGASFLIPYFIFLVAEGVPLYYMELCLGQRLRKGSIGVWHRVSPYLDGLGLASSVVCFFVCLYYNVIVAWCLFYFVSSFKNPLPWSQCPTTTISKGNQSFTKALPECVKAGPTKYFWYRTTLDISSSIEADAEINWTLALALLVAWILCWLCMVKGISSEGKVVYVTATVPMLLLAALFFRGVHLPGFQEGLALLFIPDFSRLKDPLVWLDAASQTFYSLGIAYGTLIAFASYNPLKNDTTRDALLLCLIDSSVSVYASVVIFCFIGYRAHVQMEDCLDRQKLLNLGTTIEAVVQNITPAVGLNATFTNATPATTLVLDFIVSATPFNSTVLECNKAKFLGELSHSTGLAFITFTEAINTLPYPQMWSIMFFLMLVLLAIDTQFGMLEGLITPLFDAKLFPKIRTEVITGIICLVTYLLSLTMVLKSGNYWLQIIEYYSASVPLLVIALGQCLALSYVYGVERFSKDIEYMTNKSPRKIWVVCWKVVSPLLLIVVLAFSIHGLSTTTPTYQVWDAVEAQVKIKPLPTWGVFIGVMLIFVSILCIPVAAFLRYFKIIGRKKIQSYFMRKKNTPSYDHYDRYESYPMSSL